MALVNFPKMLYAAVANQGHTDDEFLATAESPSELVNASDDLSVKVARYMLVGTGVIQHSAPVYVEDAASIADRFPS